MICGNICTFQDILFYKKENKKELMLEWQNM